MNQKQAKESFEDLTSMVHNMTGVKGMAFSRMVHVNTCVDQLIQVTDHLETCTNVAHIRSSALAVNLLALTLQSSIALLSEEFLTEAERNEAKAMAKTLLSRVYQFANKVGK